MGLQNTTDTTSGRVAHPTTCSRCKSATTVPFVPTPGRPVYCQACFTKAPARSPRRPMGRGINGQRPRHAPVRGERKRMLSQGRKGHFVHDVRAVLEEGESKVDEAQRRAFIEMVFSRGSRQSTEAAVEFVREKLDDETLTAEEAARIERLVEKYSFVR